MDSEPAVDNLPGTYILLFKLPERIDIAVGRRRKLEFKPGFYAYVGSALGHGGLTARLKRHINPRKRKHWHIDYILPHAVIFGTLTQKGKTKKECDWAAWTKNNSLQAIEGIGSSDCRCPSHLFLLGNSSNLKNFVQNAAVDLKTIFALTSEII